MQGQGKEGRFEYLVTLFEQRGFSFLQSLILACGVILATVLAVVALATRVFEMAVILVIATMITLVFARPTK